MLLLAYSYDVHPKLDSESAAMALGATSAMCAVGAACVLAACKPRYRSTFYEHCTMKTHMRNTWWRDRTTIELDGKILTDCDRELVRAYQGLNYAKCYWPMDLVEPFVRDNWYVL